MNATELQEKLAMHQKAIALLPGETVLRRYAVLQALAGERAEALDTVARLKIFATQLTRLAEAACAVYDLVDEQASR